MPNILARQYQQCHLNKTRVKMIYQLFIYFLLLICDWVVIHFGHNDNS